MKRFLNAVWPREQWSRRRSLIMGALLVVWAVVFLTVSIPGWALVLSALILIPLGTYGLAVTTIDLSRAMRELRKARGSHREVQ
jgi:uncharacterized protein (DUF58 family)